MSNNNENQMLETLNNILKNFDRQTISQDKYMTLKSLPEGRFLMKICDLIQEDRIKLSDDSKSIIYKLSSPVSCKINGAEVSITSARIRETKVSESIEIQKMSNMVDATFKLLKTVMTLIDSNGTDVIGDATKETILKSMSTTDYSRINSCYVLFLSD